MAAERKPGERTSERRLAKAVRRFVDLVRPIDDVRHVVKIDEGQTGIFTYIIRLDESVSRQVYEAEFQIMKEFEDVPLEFHVRYLDGRPFSPPESGLVFSR
ncbi:MAG TPA: hypothetical protein VFX19_10455 [Dehalococcoidia bacterium]|jgi:hypothetical protein|nr:hypothetical protein [Dehalococcoidia bacterium]